MTLDFKDEIIGGDGYRYYKMQTQDGTTLQEKVRLVPNYTPEQEGDRWGAQYASDVFFKSEGGDILGPLSVNGKDVLTTDGGSISGNLNVVGTLSQNGQQVATRNRASLSLVPYLTPDIVPLEGQTSMTQIFANGYERHMVFWVTRISGGIGEASLINVFQTALPAAYRPNVPYASFPGSLSNSYHQHVFTGRMDIGASGSGAVLTPGGGQWGTTGDFNTEFTYYSNTWI